MLVLSAIGLLCFVGVGSALPVLPIYLTRTLDTSGLELGIVLGLFPFAALAGRFIAGRLADRRGRLLTLQIGLAGTVAAGLLLALPLPLAGLAVARVVHGLAEALVYTASAAWVIDSTEARDRPRALALLGTGIWGGNSIGALLGGLLGSLVGVGLLTAGLGLLAAGLSRFAGTAPAVVADPDTSRRPSLLPRPAIVPGVSLALGNVGYAAIAGFLVLHLVDRGASGTIALAAFAATVVVGRLAVVPLATKVGLLRSLPWALVLMAAGLVVVSDTSSTLVAVLAMVAVALGYCLPLPALATLVAEQVRPSERGAGIGALTAFYDVSVGLSSLLFGVLLAHGGTTTIFRVAAGAVLVAAAVNVHLARREKLRHFPESAPAFASAAPAD